MGRISTAGGNYFLDEETLEYRLGPAFRREEQNVGGLFAQDQWRVSPRLTVNYGMRWEFSGAMANANEVYSGPTVAGPLRSVDGGVPARRAERRFESADPVCGRSRTRAISSIPRRTSAWRGTPKSRTASSARCSATQSSARNFGINYYDEGLIPFQTANGNGPGLQQTLALPTFTPGSLSLQGTHCRPTARRRRRSRSRSRCRDFTFTRGFATTAGGDEEPYDR